MPKSATLQPVFESNAERDDFCELFDTFEPVEGEFRG